MEGRTFQQRAELLLMGLFGISLVLIMQLYSMRLFQIGLGLLIVSTLLEIGVGNIPTGASVPRALTLLAVFLAIIAAVFALGIFLVPYLAGLGR